MIHTDYSGSHPFLILNGDPTTATPDASSLYPPINSYNDTTEWFWKATGFLLQLAYNFAQNFDFDDGSNLSVTGGFTINQVFKVVPPTTTGMGPRAMLSNIGTDPNHPYCLSFNTSGTFTISESSPAVFSCAGNPLAVGDTVYTSGAANSALNGTLTVASNPAPGQYTMSVNNTMAADSCSFSTLGPILSLTPAGTDTEVVGGETEEVPYSDTPVPLTPQIMCSLFEDLGFGHLCIAPDNTLRMGFHFLIGPSAASVANAFTPVLSTLGVTNNAQGENISSGGPVVGPYSFICAPPDSSADFNPNYGTFPFSEIGSIVIKNDAGTPYPAIPLYGYSGAWVPLSPPNPGDPVSGSQTLTCTATLTPDYT